MVSPRDMDASDFSRLLNTDHYSPANLEEVEQLCRNYPVFGLAHMLRVRILEGLRKDKDEALKLAAIHAGDRSLLLDMVKEVEYREEEVAIEEEVRGIEFSDEPNPEAEIIIEQHAPYASEARDDDLLELDEDEENDSPDVDLLEIVAKDDAEMEEPGEALPETPSIRAPEPKNELIQNFITEDPGPIRADKNPVTKKDASLASIREHDGFITDTLARIYVKQGLYAKAIYAYEKLSLKYPEKSAYFAAQIEKISNINRS